MTRLAPLIFLVLTLPRAASADSDGLFCSSMGYLAYEFRGGGAWSKSDQGHVLNIVLVGGADGISDSKRLLLEDFQVHGMKCEPDRIVMLGWDKKYTIGLSDQGQPQLVSVEPIQPNQIPKDYDTTSLTSSWRSKTVRIPSGDRQRTYQLQIVHRMYRPRSRSGVVYHEMTSNLIERNLSGRVLHARPIYNGVQEESVD